MPIYIAGVYDITRMAIYSITSSKGGGDKRGQIYDSCLMTEIEKGWYTI